MHTGTQTIQTLTNQNMINATLNGNFIVIKGFRHRYKKAFAGIGGITLKGGILQMRADPFLLELAIARIPELKLSRGLQQWLDRSRHVHAGFDFDAVKLGSMHDYQVTGAQWLLNGGRTILADRAGLGKTVQAISACEAIIQHQTSARTLVLCKNIHTDHWQGEIKDWSGRDSTIIKAARRERALDKWLETDGNYLIVGWSTFRVFPELQDIMWNVVVADESHKIKNRKTLTFSCFRRLKSMFMFLLSATPFSLHNAEIWTSLHAIDPKKFPSYWRFYDTFVRTIMIGDFPKIIGNKNVDVFAKVVGRYMLKRRAIDCIDELPPRRVEVLKVPMAQGQDRSYRGMCRNMIAELKGQQLAAPTELVQFTRLRQIASTTYTLWDDDHSGKLDAVVDLVDEVDGQIVIATDYRRTVEAIRKRLANERLGVMVGGSDVNKLEKAFRSGDIRIVVMTRQTGGEGINLEAAHTMIILERPWNPAEEAQLAGRVYRPAMKKEGLTRIIYLEHPGSIDSIVRRRVLRRRKLTVQTLLQILHEQEAL